MTEQSGLTKLFSLSAGNTTVGMQRFLFFITCVYFNRRVDSATATEQLQ